MNPEVDGYGFPVPFSGEVLLLARGGVELHLNKIAQLGGNTWKARGRLYLSNVRMVFIADSPSPPIHSFDFPLMFVRGERFNQPIFTCYNISGSVLPVIPEGESPALYAPHEFKIFFKEGGVGTFLPVFFSILASIRQLAHAAASSGQQEDNSARIDPLPSQQPSFDIRHAYVDPNDPTTLYLQQPTSFQDSAGGLRRRGYSSRSAPSDVC